MSHNENRRMSRRDFIGATAAVSAAGLAAGIPAASAGESASGLALSRGAKDGPITLYYEFRVAPPANIQVLAEIEAEAGRLAAERHFLSLSLKQMVGESTMVRNFPESYKGLLGTAYADGVSAQTLPFFYSLFIRFDRMGGLQRSGAIAWFQETIAPLLFVYRSDVGKTDIPFDYFTGLFLTVAAGDQDGVYHNRGDIIDFLRRQQDEPSNAYTTVNNHVSIYDRDLIEFEGKVLPLLTVAQNTYQPENDPDGEGESGTKDDSNYKRAVTTEILRNAYQNDDLRSYMMHGVWESIWDHENSHLDPRFKLASTPVGAHVVAGPIEPFYQTRILFNH